MLAKSLLAFVIVLGIASCSEGFVEFPVTSDQQKTEIENVAIVRLDATNIESFSQPARGYVVSGLPVGKALDYIIGPGDLLNVIVFDHPELMLPVSQLGAAGDSGFYVHADGSFNYPYIGLVEAGGRTARDVRVEVAERLSNFIPSPQVEVRVTAFNSQRVIVAGEVKVPNSQAIALTPTTLITAINAAGGMTETADTRAVSLQRGGRLYTIDLAGFLNAGLEQNNPMLRAGDIVTVTRRRAQEAYLLGQISKPAAIDLSQEPITLTQAITRQGGLNETRADARGVFVFRLVDSQMTVFQLEILAPTGLVLGTRFVLEPADVVYVVRSPLSRWNDTISRLLPTVTATRAAQTIAN